LNIDIVAADISLTRPGALASDAKEHSPLCNSRRKPTGSRRPQPKAAMLILHWPLRSLGWLLPMHPLAGRPAAEHSGRQVELRRFCSYAKRQLH